MAIENIIFIQLIIFFFTFCSFKSVNIKILIIMKGRWFVVFFAVFNFTRSELIYSMYNINSVPSLDKLCGLSRTQIAAAQQRYSMHS